MLGAVGSGLNSWYICMYKILKIVNIMDSFVAGNYFLPPAYTLLSFLMWHCSSGNPE